MIPEFSNCVYFQQDLVCPHLPALHGQINIFIKPGHHLYWLSIFSFSMSLCLAQLKCPFRSHTFSLVSQVFGSSPWRARDASAISNTSSSTNMASTVPALATTRVAPEARSQRCCFLLPLLDWDAVHHRVWNPASPRTKYKGVSL